MSGELSQKIQQAKAMDFLLIYGNHPNAEIVYFYLCRYHGLHGLFRGFVWDGDKAQTDWVYGKPYIFMRELDAMPSTGVLFTDRPLDAVPPHIQTIFLCPEEISALRWEYAEQLVRELGQIDALSLYGAGEYAQAIYRCLSTRLKIKQILITAQPEPNENIKGTPVVSADRALIARDALILIATDERQHLPITNFLKELAFTNYLPLSAEAAMLVYERYFQPFFEKNTSVYQLQRGLGGTAEFYILDSNAQEAFSYVPHWRLRTNNLVFWEDTVNCLSKIDLLLYYESRYGSYRCVKSVLREVIPRSDDVCIFMARSVYDVGIYQSDFPDWLVPVHAGAALASAPIASQRDDQGTHISELNVFYSEMTVLYWIWKHIAPTVPEEQFLGLCHYRRHFDITHKELACLRDSDIDIVLTCPEINVRGNLAYYLDNGAIKQPVVDLLLEVLQETYPEYLSSVQQVFESQMLHPFNMTLMRRCWLEQYCRWVFDICGELHRQCLERHLVENRYLGYITELLLPAFCAHHKEEANIAIADRKMLT